MPDLLKVVINIGFHIAQIKAFYVLSEELQLMGSQAMFPLWAWTI